MAAFSHFDYFESRAQFLRAPSASTSRLTARRSIDLEQFHPHRGFAIFLTIITCLIGLILAVYLYIAA